MQQDSERRIPPGRTLLDLKERVPYRTRPVVLYPRDRSFESWPAAPAFTLISNERLPGNGLLLLGVLLQLFGAFVFALLLRALPGAADDAVQAKLIPRQQAALILRLPDKVFLPAKVVSETGSAPSKLDKAKGVAAAVKRVSPLPPVSGAGRAVETKAQPVLIQLDQPTVAPRPAPDLPSIQYWTGFNTPVRDEPIDPGASTPASPGLSASGVIAPASPPAAPASLLALSSWLDSILGGDSPMLIDHRDADAKGSPVSIFSIFPIIPRPSQVITVPPGNYPSLAQAASGGGGNRAGDGPVQRRLVRTPYGIAEVLFLADRSERWQFPAGGTFDVIIVQPTTGSTIPGAEGLLTGKQVQTVYLWNESPRHWVMQYTLPVSAEAAPLQTGRVVELGRRSKLQAPFIRRAVMPPQALLASNRAALFHGMLRADGRFDRLEPVRVVGYEARPDLLPYLSQWQFRPAKLDGVAADVEILLFIPSE